MLLHDVGRFRPVRDQYHPAKQVGDQPPHMVGSLHQLNDGQQPIGDGRRRHVFGRMEQRLPRIFGGGHRRCGTGNSIPAGRDPTMEPSLERRLDGGAMDGLDLDQFEQAFPMAVNS